MKRRRRPLEAEILTIALASLSNDDFDVVDASIRDHVLDLQLRIPGRVEMFGAQLPLLDSDLPMPFLYDLPRDEYDFVSMARIWLQEEVATGCAEWAVTHLRDGVHYFEMALYGFRSNDQDRHRESTESASGDWDFAFVAEHMRSGRYYRSG